MHPKVWLKNLKQKKPTPVQCPAFLQSLWDGADRISFPKIRKAGREEKHHQKTPKTKEIHASTNLSAIHLARYQGSELGPNGETPP